MRPIDRYSGSRGRRRRRFGWLKTVGVVILVVVVLAVIGAAVQLFRGTPPPAVTSSAPAHLVVPGTPPALPFPGQGEATAGVLGVGTIGSSGGDTPLPIASITKVMTAYVVLTDHPLRPGEQGPSITITPADVANYQAGRAGGQSVVKVQAGETLSEYQALEGMLVPSGNNLAITLADWDAGGQPAFVDKMNATAAHLAMAHTHYADASGVDAGSVSDAADLIVLAQRAMANPVFAGIVSQAQVDLPVAGLTFNTNSLIGHNGVIGIKTGTSDAAGGCFLFSAQRIIVGKPQTVLGAVLGQRGLSELETVLGVSMSLINAVPAAVTEVTILPAGTRVGTVKVPWGTDVPVVTAQPVTLLGWPGLRAIAHMKTKVVRAGSPSGTNAGTVTVSTGSGAVTVPAVTAAAVPKTTTSWKLRRL